MKKFAILKILFLLTSSILLLSSTLKRRDLFPAKNCNLPYCQNIPFYQADFSKAYKKMEKDNKQNQVVEVPVKGSFNKNGKIENYILNAEGFIGGMTDSVSIPILGYHNDGKFIIKTKIGPFYSSSNSLKNKGMDSIFFVDLKSRKKIKSFNIPLYVGDNIALQRFKFGADYKLIIKEKLKCFSHDLNLSFKKSELEKCSGYIPGKKLKIFTSNILKKYPSKGEYYEVFYSKKLPYLIYALTYLPADT